MIPERIDPNASPDAICELAFKWKIRPELAAGIFMMAKIIPQPLQIVSGFRTWEEQKALPLGVEPWVSTHTLCPAMGADLQIIGWTKADAPPEVRRVFGGAAEVSGLRWGGGSLKDKNGISNDWNHVDLGPRPQDQPPFGEEVPVVFPP